MTSVHEADYQCNATNSVGTIISRIAKLRAGKWRRGEGVDCHANFGKTSFGP